MNTIIKWGWFEVPVEVEQIDVGSVSHDNLTDTKESCSGNWNSAMNTLNRLCAVGTDLDSELYIDVVPLSIVDCLVNHDSAD